MLTREQASALVFAFRTLTETRDAAVVRDHGNGHNNGYAVAVYERAPRGSGLVAGVRLATFSTLVEVRDYLRCTIVDEVRREVEC